MKLALLLSLVSVVGRNQAPVSLRSLHTSTRSFDIHYSKWRANDQEAPCTTPSEYELLVRHSIGIKKPLCIDGIQFDQEDIESLTCLWSQLCGEKDKYQKRLTKIFEAKMENAAKMFPDDVVRYNIRHKYEQDKKALDNLFNKKKEIIKKHLEDRAQDLDDQKSEQIFQLFSSIEQPTV